MKRRKRWLPIESTSTHSFIQSFCGIAFRFRKQSAKNARMFQGSGTRTWWQWRRQRDGLHRGSAYDYDSMGCPAGVMKTSFPDFCRTGKVLGVNRLPKTQFTEACIAAAEESGFRRKEDPERWVSVRFSWL